MRLALLLVLLVASAHGGQVLSRFRRPISYRPPRLHVRGDSFQRALQQLHGQPDALVTLQLYSKLKESGEESLPPS